MADSSFDVVSKYDKQEIANAVNTAAKEIANRYDFKNVGASIELSGESIVMKANSEDRVKACLLYTSPSPRDRTRSRMPSSA